MAQFQLLKNEQKSNDNFNPPPAQRWGLKKHTTMNTPLFDYEVLLAATILLASAILIASIVLLVNLLKEWVRENVGTRRTETIKPGEGFFFYEDGQLRYDVCDKNYADIGVIYTLLNRRVEYKDVSKL